MQSNTMRFKKVLTCLITKMGEVESKKHGIRPKLASSWPKWGPNGAQIGPSGPQVGAKFAQVGTKLAQVGPKWIPS